MSDSDLYELPDDADLPPDHRSGFVAVLGRPNVGKSTLMNAYLGEKVAIVSPLPQTTRQRQLGILTRDDAQLVFVDTPGIHKPRTRLGEFMVETASEALSDADVILFVVDVSELPTAADRAIGEQVNAVPDIPVVLALNKADQLAPKHVQRNVDAFTQLVPRAEWMLTSATRGDNLDKLLAMVAEALPEGPRYYPPDQLTDQQLRDAAAEIVREKVLLNLHEEVPHAVAVQVEEFKERTANLTYVSATVYVEKDSQKGILIGQRGEMLKRIGAAARPDIEEMLGTKVYLELWVKVLKNWRKDDSALRRLGYSRKE